MKDNTTPLLSMSGIHKSFSGVQALKGVSLELYAGECLALCGENGAGKSTLIKILGGAHQADSGTICIDGHTVDITDPVASQKLGVAIIYQEFNLVRDMSVAENIFLGRELTHNGLINHKEQVRRSDELFKRIGLKITPEEMCGNLTVAQQQTVEIAKALSLDSRIIVMDEPSAALTNQEVDALHEIIRGLKAKGIGIIYISHRLDEIFTICERFTVMRDGTYIGMEKIENVDKNKMIEMMVGRSLDQEFPKESCELGEEIIRVENLNRGKVVQDVSFSVRAGEILGISGLVGSGRTETMRLIFGADVAQKGRIYIRNKEVSIRSPQDALLNGICLLSEDRKGEGLVLNHSIQENFSLPNLKEFAPRLFIDRKKERQSFRSYVKSIRIKVANEHQLAKHLSGGNQQKIVIAKWLQRNCDVVIFDEPTRGIDVGAKYEIYLLMNELAKKGKAIIMVSSELPEVLGMSDRILVMHEGIVKGEIANPRETTQEDIMNIAIAG